MRAQRRTIQPPVFAADLKRIYDAARPGTHPSQPGEPPVNSEQAIDSRLEVKSLPLTGRGVGSSRTPISTA